MPACPPTYALFSPAKEWKRTWVQMYSRILSFKLIDSIVDLLQSFHRGVSSSPGFLDLVTT